jgi:hypothetical protein
MSCICWNCHGLGNPETVLELHNFVRLEAPTLVFISETKIEATRAQNPTSRFGFAGCVHVASDGLSGGVVLYWSKEVEVELQKNSN